MRILHVIRGMANSSGVTHIVGPLAAAQARQGHGVQIFYVAKSGGPAVVPDTRLVESREFAMTVPTRNAGWSHSLGRALSETVKDVDIVHIHAIWNFPTWWAMRTAHRAQVPYVVAPQGSLESWALGRSRYGKALYAAVAEKPYFDRAACMQALTETEARQCREFGVRARIEILPNGVDLVDMNRHREPADLRAELSLPAQSQLLLFLGRLFPKKGLDLLVPAFKLLSEENRDVFLLIAGDDAGLGYRATLQDLVVRLGLTDRVRFLGEVRGPRKVAVLRGADAFVLSSYSEGLPVAVLEAMACGLPVVATTNCNVPEISEYDAGWLVNATVEAVAAGLAEAFTSQDERRRRGRNAERLTRERFDWSQIAARSVRLYNECRQRKQPVDAPVELCS